MGDSAGAPPDPSGSPAPYHHGDLREALVAEAYSQVRSHGAEAVSLRAVAQAVGVSPSAAYHHFPDKTAILVEVAERGADELGRRSIEAAGALRVDDAEMGLARLRAIGAAYIGFAVEEPHLFRHTFGPYCPMNDKAALATGAHSARPRAVGAGAHGADTGGAGAAGADDRAADALAPHTQGGGEDSSDAYGLLVDTLDRLDALGALRRRDGLDLVAWAAVHGFASLVLDGFLPADAAPVLVDVLGSLVAPPRD